MPQVKTSFDKVPRHENVDTPTLVKAPGDVNDMNAKRLPITMANTAKSKPREQPGVLERWIARRARSMAVPANAKEQTNPSVDSPEVLAAARAHWADHCATCHAKNGGGDMEMGETHVSAGSGYA